MKPTTLRALALGLLLPLAASAQNEASAPATGSTPQPSPEAAAAAAATSIPAPPETPSLVKKGELRLNFQNASLADVLNYMSEAAGFIILQDAPIAGTVNVVSKQPVGIEDAIDLLNSVLIDKGYTAIRNGRVLKIVARNGAQKQDIPVMTGSDPSEIPHKDGMVTQILPVRYVDATKLVENLRPLLSPDATINANEASNALILADTQTNIRRIAQIVHALDTSVSSISAIRVFPLQYADSKSLATVLTQLFATDQSATSNTRNNGNNGGRNGQLPPWAANAIAQTGPTSAAQAAAARVVAVSDDQSNSVIVSAPDAALATITDIISRIDTDIADITETRIFRLEHADATETANVLNSLYSDSGVSNSTSTSGNNNNNRRAQTPAASTTAASSNRSQRSILQSRVVAVADPRTNALLVSASRDYMAQIAVTVGRLDSGDSKKQQVYIYSLENADPDNVATILRGMFSTQGSTNSSSAQPSSSALNQRTVNGASSDITNVLNSTSK